MSQTQHQPLVLRSGQEKVDCACPFLAPLSGTVSVAEGKGLRVGSILHLLPGAGPPGWGTRTPEAVAGRSLTSLSVTTARCQSREALERGLEE